MSITLPPAGTPAPPMPMYPWKPGDELYAASLNAAISQSTGVRVGVTQRRPNPSQQTNTARRGGVMRSWLEHFPEKWAPVFG